MDLIQGARHQVVGKWGIPQFPQNLSVLEPIVAHDAPGIAGGFAPDMHYPWLGDKEWGALRNGGANFFVQVRQTPYHFSW